jgi:hypothetical protein
MPGPVDLDRLFIELYADERWLRRLLEQFPEADTDGDGKITAEHAVRWHALRVPVLTPGSDDLRWLPKGISHWKEMVKMRDGVELGTEVYLPEGEGPFPVMIGRGIRQGGQLDGAHWYMAGGIACVSQDLVPEGELLSRGDHGARAGQRRDPALDTHDLIEWVADQAWCNGKTAIFGYSAGGMATLPVLTFLPKELTAVVTHIAAFDYYAVYRMRGGVATGRRYDPENPGGWEPGEPPAPERPRLPTLGPQDNVGIYKTDIAGWFDIFVQGSIDDWVAFKGTDRAVLVVGGGTHGAHPRPSRVPPDYCDSDLFWPDVPQFDLLTGEVDESSVHSVMYYFLMGDFTDPDAPGNLWQVTTEWPLPHEERALYFGVDTDTEDGPVEDASSAPEGVLRDNPVEQGSVGYTYDPRNPNMRVDFNWRSKVADGPVDQRPQRKRSDVVYFVTEPLSAPLEVIGRLWAYLYVSADVPDTTFMVKLLDIYPDGYEAMIAHGVLMSRYREGFGNPQPMEKDTVYELAVDLWSTAIVFAKGHRVGVYVTNSDAGRFAVHPNTWDAVESYDDSQAAHIEIHASEKYPSRIVLPVIAPGVSEDYDPKKHSLCRKSRPSRT